MPFNLCNRSFLTLKDFSPAEIGYLLDLSRELKAAKAAGTEQPRLLGRNIALLFEKDSTRTRCAFEVAAHDQGAHVTYLGPSGSHMGVKESIKDTARVLGRMFDAIEYRGFGQNVVEELAAYAGVPVWNGLTADFHPTQVLADFLTMREHSDKPLKDITFCFVGDGHNNVAISLMVCAAKLGMGCHIAAPAARQPAAEHLAYCRELAEHTGARIRVSDDVSEAVAGVDFLYTDVWVSMGEPEQAWAARIELLQPYQINRRMLDLTANQAVGVMHCLPAFHNRETTYGEKIFQTHGLEAMEITDEVFESGQSIVFDQAENRLHTIKAIMIATLGR
ncbi:ornithine carbamoyltransferase [Salinisphaera sp. LB1]|uniref:ornithine carbamoyltransferase n=1 Tax=Salinisphaera sp. LB1 TaxID=2183911 RepID=UPI000D706E05|nr:ornithine carbamoyltransferase [Salinisphaera sp. LB1]AWN17169.1 Ornithine carbamoyltransferase [Salinisphaera sp. LB1]